MVSDMQLSILITLMDKSDFEGYYTIKDMLDLHFSGASKFARFISHSVIPYISYYEDGGNKNYFRVNILLGKRLRFLKSKFDSENLGQGIVPNYSKTFAYLVPSSKSVFQANRNEDPAFDTLRARANKNNNLTQKKFAEDTI